MEEQPIEAESTEVVQTTGGDDRGKRLQAVYSMLDSDEAYRPYVPATYDEFLGKIAKDQNYARAIHEMVASDEVYSQYLPETFEETVTYFGLGKPSPTPQGGNGLGTQKNVGQTPMVSQEPSMSSPSSAQDLDFGFKKVVEEIGIPEDANTALRLPTEAEFAQIEKKPLTKEQQVKEAVRISTPPVERFTKDITYNKAKILSTEKELKKTEEELSAYKEKIDSSMAIYENESLSAQERNKAVDEYNRLIKESEPLTEKYNNLANNYNGFVAEQKTLFSELDKAEKMRQKGLEKEYSQSLNLIESVGRDLIKAISGITKMGSTMSDVIPNFGLITPEEEKVAKESLNNGLSELNAFAEGLISQETPENYKKLFEGDFSLGKLAYVTTNAISSTVPTVAAGLLTGPLGAMTAGAGLGFEESKSIMQDAGLSDEESNWAALGLAIPIGLLEKYGADDVVKLLNGSGIRKEVASELAKKIAGKSLTKDAIFLEAKKTFGEVIQSKTTKLLKSGRDEALTEMAQGEIQEITKQIVQEFTGVDKDENMSTMDYLKQQLMQRAEEGAGGFLGGTSMQGGGIALNAALNKQEFSPSAYTKAMEFADPAKYEQFKQDLLSEVESGVLTEDQANEALENVKAIQETNALIPNSIQDLDLRTDAVNLIIEKNNLTKEISEKDPDLTIAENERLSEIKKSLNDISLGKKPNVNPDQILSESKPKVEEVAVVEMPTSEQQFKEVKEGNTVTFQYTSEAEVPDVFKDKISSKGEINGKPSVKVTVAKSLADFYLQDQGSKVTEQAQVETPSIEAQVAEIKSKPLTRIEGANMGANQAVGTFVSTEPENRYAAQFPDAEVQQMEVDIENPFVTEDTNLIDYRNEMINRRKGELDETDFTEVEIPSGEFTISDLSDSGIEKVAAMVTEEMKAKGYDSIYFPQVGAQEGELVVFDREKVRRKGEGVPAAENIQNQTPTQDAAKIGLQQQDDQQKYQGAGGQQQGQQEDRTDQEGNVPQAEGQAGGGNIVAEGGTEQEVVGTLPKFFKKKPRSRDVVIIDIDKVRQEKPNAFEFLKKYKGNESFEVKDIRNAISIAYSQMMRYKAGAENLMAQISDLEDILEDTVQKRVQTKEEFKQQAKESGDFTPEQLDVFNILIDSLNTELMPEYDSFEDSLAFVGIDSKTHPNFYSLSDNILSAKNPDSFIHEVGHFAFYNILSKQERLEFLQYMIDSSYGKEGKSLKERLAITSETIETEVYGKKMVFATNAGDNFSEYFAEQFRQWYLKEKTTPKQFDAIFQKIADYLSSIIEKLRKGDFIDKNLVKFFDKIISDKKTEDQQGGGNRVEEGGEKKEIAIEDIDDTTVDKTDQTIIAYHATPTGKVSTGKEAGIHIGTKKAAEQVKAGRNQGKGTVEKVKTIIKRPLILSDMPSWSSANLLSQLFNPQTGQYFGLTRNDIRDIRDSDMTEKQKQQSVIDFLKKKGYDAIAYKNDSEDAGSYSYVLFEEPTIESGSTISEGVGQTQAETQQEVAGTYGNEGEVKFADGVILNHKFKLIEADDMQPSHLVSGQRNPKHLIALAQPKERNDQGSRIQQDKIADNPRLQEVGDSPIAYTGAPIVNKRGEVIQGNNRSLGLKKHYDINGTSYKQQLAENAEKFGLTKEQVMAMKKPVLVREVAASDQTAIVLGNYDVKDIETGGKQRIDPIVTSRKIKPSDRQKLTTLVFDGDKTVKEAIRDSAREIATIVKSYINPAQMKTAFSSSGEITASGMDDIEGIMNSFLYEDGPASLPEVFSSLPNVVQKGVQKGIPSLVSVDPEKSLLKDVQNAMTAAYEYIQSGADNFDVWSRSVDMFLGVSPQELFSPLELDLANKMLTAKKQSDIANIFKQYQANVTDQPAGLFDEAVPGLSKKDAIAKQFNLEYNETNDIKGTGADRVAPALRQEGQPNEPAEIGISAKEEVNVEVEQPETPASEGEGEAVELPTEEQREEIEEDGFAMPTDEEMAAKRDEIQTDLQKAIQDVKDKFGDLFNKNMGIIYDPKVEARKLYNFHVSLVNLAKQAIRSGVTTAADFAKLIGKRLDKFTERAFNDAMNDINGLPMIINSEEQMLNAEYQRVAESYAKQREDAKALRKPFLKRFVENANSGWFDVNYVAKKMLADVGGFEAIKFKNLLGGASAKAKMQYENFKREIFGGLNSVEKKLLNDIIQARTVISIDSRYDAKGEPRIKHPGDTNKESQTVFLGLEESANPKQFEKLNERADKYFDAQRELLDERLKEGRISIEQYQGMIDNDYSPRVFLEYLIDDVESGSGLASGGGKNVGKSDIKSLSDGDVNSLFHNAEWLLATNVLSTSRSIFHNRANRSLYELAKADPNNGFIEIQQPNGINKETGQPTYKDPKSDQRQIQFFENGVRKSMLVTREFGESWNNNNPLLSPQYANAIRLASGGVYKRLFATGVNPLFALANFPRDIAHALFFTNAYSPTFPIALAQISTDLVRTAKDSWKFNRNKDKNGRYYNYVMQGGGMDFLATQGLPFEQQALIQSSAKDAMDATLKVVGYTNNSSEIWVRLAIRDREINKSTAKFARDNGRMPNESEREVIETNATEVARSQMDFSKGGRWSKAMDNLIPYLNPSLVGLGSSFKYVRENPKIFAYKVAQALAISAALAAYNMRFKDDYDDIDDEEKNRNMIIMLDFFKTVDGKKRRAYIRIPKNQSSQWIFAMGEMMGETMESKEFRTRKGMSTLQTLMPPYDPRNIPIIDALNTYETGYDRFREKYVYDKDYKGEEWAEYYEGKTPWLWRDLGEQLGLSPVRLKAAVGKYTADPDNNMIWIAVTEAYDKLIKSVPEDEQKAVNDMAIESIEQLLTPVQRKFLGYTDPNSKAKSIRELAEKEETKIKLQNDTVKTFARKYINDEVSEAEVRSDFGQWLATQPKDSVNVKRLKSRFENSIRFKDIDNVFYRMTEADIPVVKAAILYEYYKGLKTDNEREVLLFQAKNAPNVPKDTKSDFWKEFNRLKANGEE